MSGRPERVGYLRERALQNRAEGICRICCKWECDGDAAVCATCRQYLKKKSQERREALVAAGLCWSCGRRRTRVHRSCSRCRQRRRARNKVVAGAFCRCGLPRVRGKVACLTCVSWFDGAKYSGSFHHSGPAMVAEMMRETSLSSDELAERVGVAKRSVLRVLSGMIAAGLAVRDVSGGKCAQFSLTREAREVRERALANH